MRFDLVKGIVIPHAVKVAVYLIVSGGLTALLNNLGSLNMPPAEFMVVAGIINLILAMITKYWGSLPANQV